MAEKAPFANMVERYERLKRQYFSRSAGRQYDDEGEELPNAVDRAAIVQMFEQMGVELPTTPDAPMQLLKRGSAT
jgi:hypothetical protein